LTSRSLDNIDRDELEKVFSVNFFAPMRIESSLLDLVKENESDVVNITSSATYEFYEKYSEYTASKLAFKNFTEYLQKELYGTKARAIEFCPGAFKSNIYKSMLGEKVERDESQQMRPEDLADIIYYIATLPRKLNVRSIVVDKSF
jgi:3-hydroxy acid dehydrogenase / malonic semialdehyde reductase